MVIALERVSPQSYAINVRAGTVFDTGVSIVLFVGIFIAAFARRVNRVVPDIGVSADVEAYMLATEITVGKFSIFPASLVESLVFCCTAFCCWPITAVLCCRALQAWIPSYHVC